MVAAVVATMILAGAIATFTMSVQKVEAFYQQPSKISPDGGPVSDINSCPSGMDC